MLIVGAADLRIEWVDGSESSFDTGWLRHVADDRHRPMAGIPTIEHWTPTTLSELPTFDGPAVLGGDQAEQLAWLGALCRSGIGRLRGLPVTDDVTPRIATSIGAMRDTNFGVTWPVSVDINPTSTANTPLPLPPHTDLPTRETPPGFQVLHCQANTTTGGLSTMADGYAVAAHLRTHDADAYEALSTLPWVFFNRSPQHDHRWSGPIIDEGAPGQPLTLRAFHPVRGFPDMPDADVPRAYAALRVFSQLASSDDFQIRTPFTAGDLVAFDNRRILHGRTVIDTTAGRRVLHGTYIDHDEIYSRVRVLSRITTPGSPKP